MMKRYRLATFHPAKLQVVQDRVGRHEQNASW
jgi:hypothetical protein